MILIVAYHATRIECIKSGESLVALITGIVLGSWEILGVDLFVIISSWYLVGRKFSCKRVVSIGFQTLIYILLSALISYGVIVYETHSITRAIKDILLHIQNAIYEPLWSKHFWFVTAYILLLLLSPFLNKILTELPKEKLSLLLKVTVFIPLISQFNVYTNTVSDVITFSYIFLMIGYIKLYGIKRLAQFCGIRYVVILICVVLSANLILLIPNIIDPVSMLLVNTVAATGRHSVIMLLTAVLLFCSVIKKDQRVNKPVNYIARFTFGVYLFHSMHVLTTDGDLLDLVASYLTKIGLLKGTALFPVEFIFFTACFFCVGVFWDMIFQKILLKPIIRGFFKHKNNIIVKIDDVMNV